jgi:FtsZ-binding cell division protein ZapB
MGDGVAAMPGNTPLNEGIAVDAKPFDALEAKINLVLERLKTAQTEKSSLQEEVALWRSRYEDATNQLEELSRERDSLKKNQRDPETEELIRTKISALLAKLEAA